MAMFNISVCSYDICAGMKIDSSGLLILWRFNVWEDLSFKLSRFCLNYKLYNYAFFEIKKMSVMYFCNIGNM